MKNMTKSENPGFRSSLVVGVGMYMDLHIYLFFTNNLELKIQLESKKLLLFLNFVLKIKPHMPNFMHLFKCNLILYFIYLYEKWPQVQVKKKQNKGI